MWFSIIILIGILSIKFIGNDFPIPLNNNSDNFEKSQFLSLLLCEIFSIDLDKLYEYSLQQLFGLLYCLINIHQCHHAVKDKTRGNDIVPKIN